MSKGEHMFEISKIDLIGGSPIGIAAYSASNGLGLNFKDAGSELLSPQQTAGIAADASRGAIVA